MTVGRPIVVGEALSKSVGMLTRYPVLILPQVIALIPGLVNIALSKSSAHLALLSLIVYVISGVVAVIVSGAYPSMVKAVVEGRQFSISEAMGKAYRKFWTLVGASILVVVIVALGFIALVVPGIILLTWYSYTIPAVMLDDRGALGGMAASRAFGRDKKSSTFLIFLVFGIAAVVVLFIQQLFVFGGAAVVGQVVQQLLFVPLGAWASVIFSFVYITYGPSAAGAATGPPAPGVMPPAQAGQPSMQGSASVTRFCPSCGSPVEPGSRFCRYCGKSL